MNSHNIYLSSWKMCCDNDLPNVFWNYVGLAIKFNTYAGGMKIRSLETMRWWISPAVAAMRLRPAMFYD